MAFVVYISVRISCGYLKYVLRFAQFSRHERDIFGYLDPQFSSTISKFESAVDSSTAAYTLFKSDSNALQSLYDTYLMEFLNGVSYLMNYTLLYFCTRVRCFYCIAKSGQSINTGYKYVLNSTAFKAI